MSRETKSSLIPAISDSELKCPLLPPIAVILQSYPTWYLRKKGLNSLYGKEEFWQTSDIRNGGSNSETSKDSDENLANENKEKCGEKLHKNYPDD
ncbi:hypothetical protein AVEN_1473-1 [Araneus ventricosus]|uniref:Uncharacterized protein n=1 Tax=Araneus ventricosus TaxID=182803 RepID=A0A4Y2M1E1_ARAVE|nr:hypothetical protein AVEN_1473-1 [Araneus ventricosus]